jgi:lysozyme family protein
MSGWFEKAVEIVLEKEGVLSEHPEDDGGVTKYGITAPALAEYRGVPVAAIAPEDIRKLTRPEAIEVYRVVFWRRVRGDDLPWAFALPLFDGAVNHGSDLAVRLFQRALGVADDGVFGSRSVAAAQKIQAAPDPVLVDYMARRAVVYAKHPDFGPMGFGWSRRAFAIALLAKG